MALTIGTQLGSHEITPLSGKGGMGEVYHALDLKLKREVAIKILPEDFERDGSRVATSWWPVHVRNPFPTCGPNPVLDYTVVRMHILD
jgi:serine/threonine protein kinase